MRTLSAITSRLCARNSALVARQIKLQKLKGLTVVTHALNIAGELADSPNVTVDYDRRDSAPVVQFICRTAGGADDPGIAGLPIQRA